MMQSIYTARMGIIAQQSRTDVIANNIANINTYGFKSSSVSFKDALHSVMQRPVESSESLNLQQGNGVMVAEINRSFAQGIPTETGIPLDMRIEGDSFFTVSSQNSEIQYTRNGAFAVSRENDTNYLVDSQGNYVMDDSLSKIGLPDNIETISVNGTGEIYVDDSLVATLYIASFGNNDGLEATKNGLFKATEASGEATRATSSFVHQGSLEGSNVDIAFEMTKLIKAQRAFSLVSKALRTADEMSGIASNMRG